MFNITLKELIEAVGGELVSSNADLDMVLGEVSINSRTVEKGQIFFAIKGEKFDGYDFIEEVVERGAGAIVFSKTQLNLMAKTDPLSSTSLTPSPQGGRRKTNLEGKNDIALICVEDTLVALGLLARFHRARFKDVRVVGITGSNGKTTTKEILFSILSLKGKTARNIGNFNNRVGLPLSVLKLDSDDKFAVFEMGTSVFGEIRILADILSPDIGLITNIGYSHLETFGSPEGVFKEKIDLFENVGSVVVNLDDEFLKNYRNDSRMTTTKTYSLNGGADVFGTDLVLSDTSTQFVLHIGDDSAEVVLPVKGRMNVLNALAAGAVASVLGFSILEIKKGIENFVPPQMRMETVIVDDVVLINDAYNSNPSSVKESILSICDSYKNKDIVLVLGDMLELGEKSSTYHKEVGEFINSKKVNAVYLLGQMMSNAALEIHNKQVFHTNDSSALIAELSQYKFDENSVVLFKGSRGMKLDLVYVEINNILKGRK